MDQCPQAVLNQLYMLNEHLQKYRAVTQRSLPQSSERCAFTCYIRRCVRCFENPIKKKIIENRKTFSISLTAGHQV